MDHPLVSALLQEYKECARGEGVNSIVRFTKMLTLYCSIVTRLTSTFLLVCF